MLGNHEEAENAAQDVFEKLRYQTKDIKYPKSFLFKAATNMVLTRKKKTEREAQNLFAEATNTSINCLRKKTEREIRELFLNSFHEENQKYINQFELVDVNLLINSLFNEEDEKSKIAYFMKYYDGMTLRDIGLSIGLSKSAVEKRINILRKKLQQKMNKDKQ